MKTVLVLCTGNSARSILAEAIFNRKGAGRLKASSAGSQPKDAPHPQTIKLLAAKGYDTEGFRSKSWDEFASSNTPPIDIVITVCDSADGETCPVWPGAPVRAHWGIADPATASNEDEREAFEKAYRELKERVEAFLDEPFETLSEAELAGLLNRIGGQSAGATKRSQVGTGR